MDFHMVYVWLYMSVGNFRPVVIGSCSHLSRMETNEPLAMDIRQSRVSLQL